MRTRPHRRTRAALCVLALALMCAAAMADDKPAQGPYRIGVDDVIEISVKSNPELTKTVTVAPDGTVAHAEIGQLMAKGKTPEELAAEIQKILNKTYVDPVVVVTVMTVKSQKVRVVGAVKASGVLDYRTGMRLLDLLAGAQGLTARPAQVRGKLVRGADAIVLDIPGAVSKPESDANLALKPDDLVMLEEQDPTKNVAYVVGSVKSPGAYPLGDEGLGLLALLARAGNPTEEAALTRCYVQRGASEMPVNLLTTFQQGTPDAAIKSFEIQPGDVLFVPKNDSRFGVMGTVAKPGQFTLSEVRPLTVIDALAMAGGQTREADLKKAGVIRVVNGKPEVLPVDLDKMLARKDMAGNIALQRDDIVFVPEKKKGGFDWSKVTAPIMALYYLGLGR